MGGIDLINNAIGRAHIAKEEYQDWKQTGKKEDGVLFQEYNNSGLKSAKKSNLMISFNSSGNFLQQMISGQNNSLVNAIWSEDESSVTYFADVDGDGNYDARVYEEYDEQGNIIQQKYDANNNGNYEDKYDYQYDKDGNKIFEGHTTDFGDDKSDDVRSEKAMTQMEK